MQEYPLGAYNELDRHGNIITRSIGNALTISKRPEAPIQVFLWAHTDTVYAPEHQF